jgi:hypothetical protein
MLNRSVGDGEDGGVLDQQNRGSFRVGRIGRDRAQRYYKIQRYDNCENF